MRQTHVLEENIPIKILIRGIDSQINCIFILNHWNHGKPFKPISISTSLPCRLELLLKFKCYDSHQMKPGEKMGRSTGKALNQKHQFLIKFHDLYCKDPIPLDASTNHGHKQPSYIVSASNNSNQLKILIKIEVSPEDENTQNPYSKVNHHKANQFYRYFDHLCLFCFSLSADLCATHYIVVLIFCLKNQGENCRK